MRASPGQHLHCTVEGCDRKYRSLGLCAMHYQRVRKGKDVGPVGSHFTGRGSATKAGYRRLRKYDETGGKTGWVLIHRKVMADHLGRALLAHETVHHKDGDRENNEIDNLELWSHRHGPGQRVSDRIEFAQSFLTEYGITHSTFTPSEAVAGFMGCG